MQPDDTVAVSVGNIVQQYGDDRNCWDLKFSRHWEVYDDDGDGGDGGGGGDRGDILLGSTGSSGRHQ